MSQKMVNRKGLLVIVSTFLIRVLFVLDVPSAIINIGYPGNATVTLNFVVGVSLLLFPLFGLIADVYLTRYRMIQLSFMLLIFVSVTALVVGAVVIISSHICGSR